MRIHAIQTGTVRVTERQREGVGPGPLRAVATMADRRFTEPLPILAFLVEHPDGLILVDTGETARATRRGYFPGWHPYYRLAVRFAIEADEEIGPQIERLGHSPRDVRWVVQTHLHTDHAGGLHHLHGSEVVVSRAEWAFATGRRGVLLGYPRRHWPDWLAPTTIDFDGPAFGPFAASRPLTEAGDVVLLPTPGHTPGHLSVAVRDGDRLVVLAGDASYSQELMLRGAADGVTDDPATARQTLARLRELAASEPTVYLPAHDADAPRRLAAREPVPAA
jgi:N-acyl homoserine lactone hydrolase